MFRLECSMSRQFLLGLARPRTRRDRRAGRLSALAGGGPARRRHRRFRNPKAVIAAPVPPGFRPISFVGPRSSRCRRSVETAAGPEPGASPYRLVRLAARVLWQPQISPSRARRRPARPVEKGPPPRLLRCNPAPSAVTLQKFGTVDAVHVASQHGAAALRSAKPGSGGKITSVGERVQNARSAGKGARHAPKQSVEGRCVPRTTHTRERNIRSGPRLSVCRLADEALAAGQAHGRTRIAPDGCGAGSCDVPFRKCARARRA